MKGAAVVFGVLLLVVLGALLLGAVLSFGYGIAQEVAG